MSQRRLGDAYRALKEPLRFGDDQQIEAVELIASIQAAVEAVKRLDTLEAREAFDDWYMNARERFLEDLR